MSKSIAVDLSDYRVDVMQDGALTGRITDFAFGRDGHHTAMGATALSSQRELRHWSRTYSAWMPYAMFFNDGSGCAFHQGDTSVASHGCIHLKPADAAWLFDWAGADPVGLHIAGPYPALQISAKVYKAGAPAMCRETIAAIQAALARNGFASTDPAGTFAAATAAQVAAFQTAQHLTADGAVGPTTATHLHVTL